MNEHPANLKALARRITKPWQPHLAATVNEYDVKVARFDGEFTWHPHPDTDEFFFSLDERITVELRDRHVDPGPLEAFTVPKGVEHRPRSDGDALVMPVEPQGTINAGDSPSAPTSELRDFEGGN